MTKELTLSMPKDLREDFGAVSDLIGEYRTKLSDSSTEGEAVILFGTILQYGAKFRTGEKVYKIAQGMIYSAIRATVVDGTYVAILSEQFDITPQTANKYALIYEALYSGEFLYTLPKDYNPLSLSVRDMELLSQLIVEGELTEERAHVVFSDGGWQEKRDVVREEAPAVVKRNGSRAKKQPQKKKLRFKGGHIHFKIGQVSKRIGFLDLDNPDPAIRSIAMRAKEAIRKEFGKEFI